MYKATLKTRPWREEFIQGGWDIGGGGGTAWKTCVRDASWHPNAGVLAATSWNGYGASTGSVTLHGSGVGEKGEAPVRLNCWGKRDPRLYEDSQRLQEEESSDEEEERERTRARVLRRRFL